MSNTVTENFLKIQLLPNCWVKITRNRETKKKNLFCKFSQTSINYSISYYMIHLMPIFHADNGWTI